MMPCFKSARQIFTLIAALVLVLFVAGGAARVVMNDVHGSSGATSSSEGLAPSDANGAEARFAHPYGVFLGVSPDESSVMDEYRLVVIDAAAYSAEDVARLKRQGHLVYSYLNTGSIEAYRPYYEQACPFAFAAYEGWPDESWVDVTQDGWSDFVVGELARPLAAKGIDGFFLDNADVYELLPADEAYESLQGLVSGIDSVGLPIIMNGGGTFVSRLIEDEASGLISNGAIDGVNQEEVFTAYDFSSRSYGAQDAESTEEFKAYLERCDKAGLRAYMVEYRPNDSLSLEIEEYCSSRGFVCYAAPSIELAG